MAFVIPSVFTAVDNFSGPVKGMAKNVNDFAKTAQGAAAKINDSFAKAGQNVSKGFKAALTGAAIASPLILAAKSAIDFEDNMTGVAKTAGLSGKQLEAVGAGILQISKHTRTSIKDLQTIAEVGGRLGVAGDDILKFTEASNKFAVALGSDYGGGVEEAISQVGKIKNVFKELRSVPISDVITKAGSAINDLTSIGATAENMNDFILRVGALPDAIKPAFPAVAALGAFFQKAGIDSQIAASGFSNFLLVAAKNIGGFAAQMKITQKAASNLLATDPTTFATKFASSLNGLKPDALAEKLKKLKIESQESIKVLGVLGGSTALLAELQKRASAAFDKGTSLQIEYDKVNSTTAAKIGITINNFEVLAITIGTKLIPVLVPVIDKFVTIIGKVSEWIDKNPKLVNAIITTIGVISGLAFVISGVNFVIAGYRAAVGIAAGITWLWNAALVAINFVQGITAVVTGSVTGALLANRAAYLDVVLATNIASATQWLFNASLYGCPIVWIIAGIIALIAVIVIITKKWDSWGAAVSVFLGPLGLVISLFESFYRNWEMIKKGFKTDGILGGLKAIGKTLLDAVLMPLQQILEIVGKIPGKLGAMARSGAANIEQFRKDLGVNVTSDDPQTTQAPAIAVNPKQSQQQATAYMMQNSGSNFGGTLTVQNNSNQEVKASNVTGPVKIQTKPNVANWKNK